ncbi:PREDICTED: uncharacterized protein LOC108968290 [Bactrocera latifrons]|uniref:uncharacterized protein LOC108968290 n=1 Tax=Bactrocera latifrons TaxID=174628 RepID=UPI0008DC9D53|nr:PREDICTED: uncharacterized protein LOC108968290 [Bactrocera latifrons]
MSTPRLREKIYLLGHYSNEIVGSKLPSVKQVLNVFFFNLRVCKLTVRGSASLAVREAMIYWEKARIPTQELKNCIPKLEGLYQQFRQLQKHAGRLSEVHKKKETDFLEKLEDLFDIEHANALSIITVEEDKQFLINQRLRGRPGFMYGIDYQLIAKEARVSERKMQEMKRKKRSDHEMQQLTQPAMLMTSSLSSSEDLDFCDLEEVPRVSKDLSPQAKRKRGRRTIITPKLAAALDKCKISDRNAVHILVAAIEALGYNVENFAINRCSIHNFRENLREQKAAEIKNIFKDRKLHAATLHWDGKLLPALTGKETDFCNSFKLWY